MTRMSSVSVGGQMATTTSARKSVGIASSASTIRIMIESVTPPKYPAIAPHNVPTTGREEGGGEPDLQGDLAAGHEPAEDVVAVLVGAERMPGARGQVLVCQVHVHLVGVVEQRPDEAEPEDQHEQHHADDREPVLEEDLKPAHEHAARLRLWQRTSATRRCRPRDPGLPRPR